MTQDIILTSPTRRALRDSGYYRVFHHFVSNYPPAAGVLNRVVYRVGAEITLPDTQKTLLTTTWAHYAPFVNDIRARLSANNAEYMVVALDAALAPLAEALNARVAAPDGHTWQIEKTSGWNQWRQANPGELAITAGRFIPGHQADFDAHRVALERWALGHTFTREISVTAQWPQTTAFA